MGMPGDTYLAKYHGWMPSGLPVAAGGAPGVGCVTRHRKMQLGSKTGKPVSCGPVTEKAPGKKPALPETSAAGTTESFSGNLCGCRTISIDVPRHVERRPGCCMGNLRRPLRFAVKSQSERDPTPCNCPITADVGLGPIRGCALAVIGFLFFYNLNSGGPWTTLTSLSSARPRRSPMPWPPSARQPASQPPTAPSAPRFEPRRGATNSRHHERFGHAHARIAD